MADKDVKLSLDKDNKGEVVATREESAPKPATKKTVKKEVKTGRFQEDRNKTR